MTHELSARTLALLRVVGRTPESPAAPLELSSLEVIQLVDALEVALDLLVPADRIVRSNFVTAAALEALVASLDTHGGSR